MTMDDDIDGILRTMGTIAVVGVSDDPARPSHRVARYLLQSGYRVIPVNPQISSFLGMRSFPDLRSVPPDLHPIDVVDIFRRPEEVPAVVAQAIEVGARNIWMQEGVISREGARMATEAGLGLVMDRCMMKELLARRGGPKNGPGRI